MSLNEINQDKIELPVFLQNQFCTYLFHALPICVLKTNPSFDVWAIENYVNCYFMRDDCLFYEPQLPGFLGYSNNLIDYTTRLVKTESETIAQKLIDKLNENQYVYILMDEYYLPGKPVYQKRHFVHDTLLYGYNSQDNTFLAITKYDEYAVLQKAVYSYNDIEAGFIASRQPQYEDNPVFFSINNNLSHYKFSFNNYLINLIAYVNGIPVKNDCGLNKFCDYSPYGIECYSVWLEKLGNSEFFNFEDFRNSHFNFEHKQNLMRGFEFILEQHYVPDEFSSFLDSFRAVINQAGILRMLFLKYIVIHDNSSDKFKELAPIRNNIICEIKKIKHTEKHTLIKITEYLKKYCSADKINMIDYHPLKDCISGIPNLFENSHTIIKDCDNDYCGYKYHNHIVIQLENNKNIRAIQFVSRELVRVVLPTTAIESNVLNEQFPQIRVVNVHDYVNEILLDVYSNYVIDIKSMNIAIWPESLTYENNIIASSCWQTDGTAPSVTSDAQNALKYNPLIFWDAQQHFKGNEYIEVDLGAVTPVNRIIVRERTDVQRITEYEIDGYDGKDEKFVLAKRCETLNGERIIHDFPTVYINKIRLIITKTIADYMGNTEPGICNFEAYNIE